MYEYGNGVANSNGYFTYGSSPRIKRVTVTVSEYDENGNCVKETVTETEYVDTVSPYTPYPYQPTWTSSASYVVNGDDK